MHRLLFLAKRLSGGKAQQIGLLKIEPSSVLGCHEAAKCALAVLLKRG